MALNVKPPKVETAILDRAVITFGDSTNHKKPIVLESNKKDFDFLFKYEASRNAFVIEKKHMQIVAQKDATEPSTGAKLATDMDLKQIANVTEYKGENIEKYTIDFEKQFTVLLHLKNQDTCEISVRNSKFRFNQIIKWINLLIKR